MTARSLARRERGMTLVELMVGLIVMSIVVGFIFRIFSVSSVAYRSQARVSELQQTLRTSKDIMVRDLRSAGHLARSLHAGISGVDAVLPGLSVVNDADNTGPDSFLAIYGDPSCVAHVTKNSVWDGKESIVDDLPGCIEDKDLVIAVRTAGLNHGEGCVLEVTGTVAPNVIQHFPGGDWNLGIANDQCANIAGTANDGGTLIVKLVARAYRIRPGDGRGVLEMSPTGNLTGANDWQPLAFGIVDLQLALRIHDPAGVVDLDGDGDPLRNWFSSDNMEDPTLLTAGRQVLQARLSIVSRTTAEVEGVITEATPNLQGSPVANNFVGDRPSVALFDTANNPLITDEDSRYYGRHIYRWSTTTIDFRNMGIGQ